jgi:uncharacterized membrane protein HdeD (DUF308 family)
MIHELAKYWWMVVLRGVLAVLFALTAFIWPTITLAILVIFLGAYLLIDGIFALLHGFRIMKTDRSWWGFVLLGLAGIAAGLVALFMPGITTLFLVTLVALWSIATGILEIIIAIRLRKEITGEWMLILAGVFSLIFGILLLMQPVAGVVVIAWWLGAYALFLGIFLLSVGFRLRRVFREFKHV